MCGLERDQLPEQLVVFGVADLRGVSDVVQLVGSLDGCREFGMSNGGGLDVDRRRFGDEFGIDRRERDVHTGEGTDSPPRPQDSGRERQVEVPDGLVQVADDRGDDAGGPPTVRVDGRAFHEETAILLVDGRGP